LTGREGREGREEREGFAKGAKKQTKFLLYSFRVLRETFASFAASCPLS
jgi:hypothetical protein